METIRKLYRSEATVLGFVAVAAFSLTLPCTRLGIPFFGAAGVSVARAALGGLGAVVILLVQRAPFPPARDLRDLAIVAATSVIGFPALAAFAMWRAPASHGAVVLALVPLLTALIGSRLSAERLPARFWVAAVFGSAVVAVFALRGTRSGLASADALLVIGSVVSAIGYAYGGVLSRRLGGTRVMCWALVLCLPLTLPLALVELPVFAAPAPPSAWLAVVYLGLVSQLGGFFLWNHALAAGSIARVSQVQLLQPFLTIAAAAWLAGEAVRPELVAFAATVALTVAAGRSRPSRSRPGAALPAAPISIPPSIAPAFHRKPAP